jgi:hypothetical protein
MTPNMVHLIFLSTDPEREIVRGKFIGKCSWDHKGKGISH